METAALSFLAERTRTHVHVHALARLYCTGARPYTGTAAGKKALDKDED